MERLKFNSKNYKIGNLMRKSLLALGILLIVLGVIAYAVLLIPNNHATLVSGEAITVAAGSNVPRIFHLPFHAYVSGNMESVSGGNNDVDFYVFDKNNYDLWTKGQSANRYLFIYRAMTGTQFSFRTDWEADYYFVFNNPVGWPFGSNRYVSWSAQYEYKPYELYASLTLVSLVIAGSLIIATASFTEFRHRQKMKQLRVCPSCGQKVPIQKPICPHCGFDITKSIRCEYCKTIYDRSFQKCPNCGAENK